MTCEAHNHKIVETSGRPRVVEAWQQLRICKCWREGRVRISLDPHFVQQPSR